VCKGAQTQLSDQHELERQLATADEETEIQSLNGVVNNIQGGFRQIVDNIKALEKERDDLQLKFAEKECKLQHKLNDLNNKQQTLDKQSQSICDKNHHIAVLHKPLLKEHKLESREDLAPILKPCIVKLISSEEKQKDLAHTPEANHIGGTAVPKVPTKTVVLHVEGSM
jgi:chromosome segregation ATPase